MPHIIIVGGGISGLSTAYYLQEFARANGLRISYTLFEQAADLGGLIATESRDGYTIDGGPDSFVTRKPWATNLCAELGLADRLIPVNPYPEPFYILKDGQQLPIPIGTQFAVPTNLASLRQTPLLSRTAKQRVRGDLKQRPRRQRGDESVASFYRRHFGNEALRWLGAPFLAGVHAADPERLSVKASYPTLLKLEQRYGSLIRGLRATSPAPSSTTGPAPGIFSSLRGGMSELIVALRERLAGTVRTGANVQSVAVTPAGLTVNIASEAAPHAADAVVLAIPSRIAAAVLQPLDKALAGQLQQIRWVSTATISLGYRRGDIASPAAMHGVGLFVPACEQRLILGCTWTSRKFNHRADANSVLIRVFVGGPFQESVVDRSDDELLTSVRSELRDLIGLDATPVVAKIFRWPQGNPQYDVGHVDRVAAIMKAAHAIPGLYLTGNSYGGVGIPDCVRAAKEVAARIGQRFRGVSAGSGR